MKCFTYATSSPFELWRLIHNPFLEVKILGSGKPWNGFMDKILGYYDQCVSEEDDEILIFLDGFDSEIRQSGDVILQNFNGLGATAVFGIDIHVGPRDLGCNINLTFAEMVFHQQSPHPFTINSGMCMGYAKTLREIFRQMIEIHQEEGIRDDQVAINVLYKRKTLPKGLIIDLEHQLFMNFQPCCLHKITDRNKTCFLQYPASLTRDRITRGIQEYYEFFPFLPQWPGVDKALQTVATTCVSIGFDALEHILVPPSCRHEPLVSIDLYARNIKSPWKDIETLFRDLHFLDKTLPKGRHTGLVLNKTWILEKDMDRVGLSPFDPKDPLAEDILFLSIPIPEEFPVTTLYDVVERTRLYMGLSLFFSYDVLRNNCHHFVEFVLRANGLWQEKFRDHARTEFVQQHIHHVVDTFVQKRIFPFLDKARYFIW